MKKIFLLSIFSIVFAHVQAQNDNYKNFNRLEPAGDMPEYFKTILQKQDMVFTSQTNDLKLLDEKFVFSLLMNGKILYGDPVSNYLNQLLDKILEHKPELRKEVQIYALKSEQVNAFSTPKGTIFVNIGLIARCTNEAELALIICHELAHYTKSHTEDKLKMNPDKISNIDDFLKYRSQSRELELNADKYAFLDFFKDLGYSFEVFEDVFDLLQYAYLPFEEKKITRAFFENEYYQFPDNYFLLNTAPVTSREKYIDTLSTHPNILNRRLELRKIVGQFPNPYTSTAFFEKPFQEAKMLSQFESINQMIINHCYLEAYYNSCALQDLYPQHIFLKQTETAALYALYRLKSTSNYASRVTKASYLQGEIQFPAFFLEKLSKKELAVWTLRALWNTLQSDPFNDYLSQLFNDMVKDIVITIGDLNQFCDYRMSDTLIIEQKADTSMVSKGKYDRYKEKILIPPTPKFKVENYMLADLKQDDKFVEAFTLGILSAEQTAVNKLISSYRGKSKEKSPIVIFQPALDLKGVSEKKNRKQTLVLEKDCKKMAKSCRFIPQIVTSTSYNSTYSYPVYVRLLEFERNLTFLIPLSYETRQSDELYKIIGTRYLNFVELSKTKAGMGGGNIVYNASLTALSVFLYPVAPFAVLSWLPQRSSASLTFSLYDLQDKKYLHCSTHNFTINNDKSEYYQTLYESYYSAKKAIKQ